MDCAVLHPKRWGSCLAEMLGAHGDCVGTAAAKAWGGGDADPPPQDPEWSIKCPGTPKPQPLAFCLPPAAPPEPAPSSRSPKWPRYAKELV